ncbi:MAG: transcription-repair coupling factor (superfamily II helicase), partial [Chitinophagales bacterium]
MSKTILSVPVPSSANPLHVGQLYGSSRSLFLAEQITEYKGLSVIVCNDMADADQVEQEILFFSHQKHEIFRFPDLETLPYDQFSPHQDIISERIKCLANIPFAKQGILTLPISTLLQKVAPSHFIQQRSLCLKIGETRDPIQLREDLIQFGYRSVSRVEEHGEFASRGSIVDLFPMGSRTPFRIEFFDDDIESIRSFDIEDQRSLKKLTEVNLLPAQEFPLDAAGIKTFREKFREKFDINPNSCPVYADVSQGSSSPGVEYYLPLFFDQLFSLFDYLPDNAQFLIDQSAFDTCQSFRDQVDERYEMRRYNVTRPLLKPEELFLDTEAVKTALGAFP